MEWGMGIEIWTCAKYFEGFSSGTEPEPNGRGTVAATRPQETSTAIRLIKNPQLQSIERQRLIDTHTPQKDSDYGSKRIYRRSGY